MHAPKALLNAVSYYNGKTFCLRGGQEHRDLNFHNSHEKKTTISTLNIHQKTSKGDGHKCAWRRSVYLSLNKRV